MAASDLSSSSQDKAIDSLIPAEASEHSLRTPRSKTLSVCWRLYRMGMRQRSTWLFMFLALLVLAGVNGLLVMMTHDLLEVFGPIMMSQELRETLSDESKSQLISDMKTLAINFFWLVIPASVAAGGSWYLSQVVASGRCMRSGNVS